MRPRPYTQHGIGERQRVSSASRSFRAMDDKGSEEEKRRKQQKPQCDAARAEEILRARFGWLDIVPGSVKQVDSYDDVNFYLKASVSRADAGGDDAPAAKRARGEELEYLFKVHNGVETTNHAFVLAQSRALRKLWGAGILCSAPQPVAGPEHADDGTAADADDDERYVTHGELPLKGGAAGETCRHAFRLLRWIPGKLLSDVAPSEPVLRGAGAFLARVDDVMATIDGLGAAVRMHMWDLANTWRLEGFTHAVASPLILSPLPAAERTALVEGVIAAFNARVRPAFDARESAGKDAADGTGLRMAVIQDDANDHNIIVDANGEPGALAIIDFGDMVHTFVVNQIAIAMAYMMIGSVSQHAKAHGADAAPPPAAMLLQDAAWLFAGYHSKRPLTDAERSLLYVLCACRLTQSVTLGAYSILQEPQNAEYLSVHAKPGWTALKLLWATDESAFNAALEAAVEGGGAKL